MHARSETKGLWAGDFEAPQEWRKEQEALREPPQQQPNRPADLVDQFVDWMNRVLGEFW